MADAQLELGTALRDLSVATDAKFRLLASVGHELRTPVHGILGMQRLLETTDLDEKQAEYVELLGVSGSYLNWSVDNLMTAALGESGEAVIDPFDLSGSSWPGSAVSASPKGAGSRAQMSLNAAAKLSIKSHWR